MGLTDKLRILKMDLQIATSAYDELLLQMISSAEGMISREGIVLDDKKAEDTQLVVMYAAYLYRRRRDENPAMPRSLRFALNNRLFSQKAGGGNAG